MKGIKILTFIIAAAVLLTPAAMFAKGPRISVSLNLFDAIVARPPPPVPVIRERVYIAPPAPMPVIHERVYIAPPPPPPRQVIREYYYYPELYQRDCPGYFEEIHAHRHCH